MLLTHSMLFEKYEAPLTVNILLPFLAPLMATVPATCWSVSPVSFKQFEVYPLINLNW